MDVTFLNLLKTSEGDVPANIKNRMERIENKEYVVLVAVSLTFYHHSNILIAIGLEIIASPKLSMQQLINSLSNNDGDDHESVTYEVALPSQTLLRLLPQFQLAKCWRFFFWSWIPKTCIEVQEKKKQVGVFRPPQNRWR